MSIYLLIDEANAKGPELDFLLSFHGVGELRVEKLSRIEEDSDGELRARLNHPTGDTLPIPHFRDVTSIASHDATEPKDNAHAQAIKRAMVLTYLARHLGASIVVSSDQQTAAAVVNHGLLDPSVLLSAGEALALVGAHVRQHEEVVLGGKPRYRQRRSEVYPLTARFAIPHGQDWWASCVRSIRHDRLESLRLAEAVFKRFGQALRARDCVHESLRAFEGRSAILEALYHFDVALTSCVAALDALALVAHRTYGTTENERNVGWQKDAWREELAVVAPQVAAVVAPSTIEGTTLRLITTVRNSIHGIPLDEYLQAHVGSDAIRLEHRAMLSKALAARLLHVGAPLGSLEKFGLHIPDVGESHVNLGAFTEKVLYWSLEIISTLCARMLATVEFAPGEKVAWKPLEWQEIEHCVSLCRVGEYPVSRVPGVSGRPSTHARIAASIRRHLPPQR